MRTIALACLLVVVATCQRADTKAPDIVEQAPSPAVADKERPCPPSTSSTAPVVIADEILVLQRWMPLRWIARDEHLHELGADPKRPVDLGGGNKLRGPVWDDRYFYRRHCFKNCDGGTSLGVPAAIERIDRATGASTQLSDHHYGLHRILLFGDHVYWGIYGHQIGGGVWRVPKAGGKEEQVRIARNPEDEDRVEELTPYPDGILVQGTQSIAWIPAHGMPRTIVAVEQDAGPAVRDGEAFYVAEGGDPYWQSKDSGFIHRVDADGKNTRLAGPVRWPSAIATHGAHIYFMLRDSGDVWSVPKAGGAPTVVVQNGPRKRQCDETLGLWADDRGLFWLRGQRFMGDGDTLYFAAWSTLTSPERSRTPSPRPPASPPPASHPPSSAQP
jgi:hypothetical protein